MSLRISLTRFHGKDEVRHRNWMDDEEQQKMIAKMFRELTHEKPPRGRTGRQLPQDQGICVVTTKYRTSYGTSYNHHIEQVSRFPDEELAIFEQRLANKNARLSSNKEDIVRLLGMAETEKAKARVEGPVNGLIELISGLMGYTLISKKMDQAWTGGPFRAILKFEGFEVQVKELK